MNFFEYKTTISKSLIGDLTPYSQKRDKTALGKAKSKIDAGVC